MGGDEGAQAQELQEALRVAVQEELFVQQKIKQAAEVFQLQLARIPLPPQNNKTEGLRQSLHTTRQRCDVLDRCMSFDLFERWRRQLDWELHAGGQVELDNAISLVGWAPAAELAAKSAAAQRAAGVKERLEAQLMEAQRSLLRLRSRYHGLPHEMQELYQQLAEEKRQTNEWWEWHTARLPQYHEDFMQLRQMEAWSSTMHQKMQECQEQLAQNRKEEEMAEAEMANARQSLFINEAQVEKALSLLQECEMQEKELQKQAILEPYKVDRIRRVQHCGERLQEAQELRRSLELAKEEAKKTDAFAQEARKGVNLRTVRVTEELRDAQRHLQFLQDLRAQEFARLGEVEREKQHLLEAHRKGAVEHERLKCQLHALSEGPTDAELPKSQYPMSSQLFLPDPPPGPPGRSTEPSFGSVFGETVQQSFAPRRPL